MTEIDDSNPYEASSRHAVGDGDSRVDVPSTRCPTRNGGQVTRRVVP